MPKQAYVVYDIIYAIYVHTILHMVYCIVEAIQYAFSAHAARINYKMKIKIKIFILLTPPSLLKAIRAR